MVNNPTLTPKQKDLALQLSRYDEKIRLAYLGSIHAIQQEEYPNRIIHFAHSLREVIDLLARSNQTGDQRNGSLDRKERKRLLQSVIDPIGKQAYAYDDEYQTLVDEHYDLSSIAHHKKIISDEQGYSKLSIIEDILHMFTMPQITINEEIDNIVSHSPSLKEAKQLTKLQFRWATQSQLIEKLPQNWLPYMIEAGFFNDPQPVTFSNNQPKYPYWAPSNYLIKCVNTFPKEVTNIILSCTFNNPKGRNPAIYADFITCALNLPLDSLIKISQKMLDEQWHDFIENYWFTEKYVDVMEKLFLYGKYDIAIKLARNVFSPTLSKPRSVPKTLDEWTEYQDAVPFFDFYWFEQILRDKIPNLVQNNPILVTELIANLLEDSIILDNQGKKIDDRYEDRLVTWRPTIEDSDQNWSSNIQSIFVVHLRNCLLHVGNNDIQKLKHVMSFLYEKNYWIFRRLELYVYTKFPNEFEREIALSILWYFDEFHTHHEYYNLIKTAFEATPSFIKQKIFELIDNGLNSERFERIKNQDGEDIAILREKHWKLRHLESIKDNLDEKHSEIYKKLIDEIGSLEHPEHLSYRTSSIGQPSIDPQLFEGKNIDEIFEIVKDYMIPKEGFAFEDKTVTTFGEYVENNPLECSKKSFELRDADSNIQYRLFSGMTNALRNNKNIEWENVLPLIEYVISSARKDKTYDRVSSIYSLLEEGFKKDFIKFELKERLWQIIKLLVEIGTQFQESTDYPNSQTDPLTMSINNINGLSFHVLYQYAVWFEKHSETKRFLVPEVKQIFDDYLEQKLGGHTVSRHAVLGVFFPNFYYLDQSWVKTILEKIPSSKNAKIAFWEGYVNWNRLYTYVFSDLHEWYDQFLNKDFVRNIERKQSYESTIDHTLLAYFYDLQNTDEFFEKFLTNADEYSLEHCVFQIGIIIDGKENDPKFNKQKLIKLWQHTSILSQDLDRWFRDSPLDKKTTISLYLNYVKNYPKKFNLISTSISELSSYLDDFPQEAAACLELLIDKQANNYIPREIKTVLQSLLALKDEQINVICKSIIEKLAILGNDWRDLL